MNAQFQKYINDSFMRDMTRRLPPRKYDRSTTFFTLTREGIVEPSKWYQGNNLKTRKMRKTEFFRFLFQNMSKFETLKVIYCKI